MKIRLGTAVAYTYPLHDRKTISLVWDFPLLQEILSFLQEKKIYISSTRSVNAVTEHLGALCGPSDMGEEKPPKR